MKKDSRKNSPAYFSPPREAGIFLPAGIIHRRLRIESKCHH